MKKILIGLFLVIIFCYMQSQIEHLESRQSDMESNFQARITELEEKIFDTD